jgi:hypothetical protein
MAALDTPQVATGFEIRVTRQTERSSDCIVVDGQERTKVRFLLRQSFANLVERLVLLTEGLAKQSVGIGALHRSTVT